MGLILVYITCRNRKEARRISLHLLEKNLVACTNIFPIKSFYWWKNKIEKSREFVLIAKTMNKNFKKIEKDVRRIHSYSLPCIIKLKVEANRDFEEWVRKVVE